MAYGAVPDASDEYMQMGAITARSIDYTAIASNDLWIWHAFFGVSGMNNDVNTLRQSPLFNDLKVEKALDVPSVANNIHTHIVVVFGVFLHYSSWLRRKNNLNLGLLILAYGAYVPRIEHAGNIG
nr:hypothetical protein [Tanacetum cinerariifolium]